MKKKVLFLIESLIAGGAERVLIDLVNSIDKRRFDITVITVFKESIYDWYQCKFDEPLSDDVHYRYLIDNTSSVKYRLFNFAFNRLPKSWLHRWLIGTDYDTEVAWYEGLPTTFLAHSSNKKSRKLAWLHYGGGLSINNEEQRKAFQQIYASYDTIVGVSEGVSRDFISKMGEGFPVLTRYNLIDDQLIAKKAQAILAERNTDLPLFVCVGRVCEVKGYDRLLRVCKRLQDGGKRFLLNIIGGGDNAALMTFVNQNGLQDCVSFLGHQSNPLPYVKAADWFVCGSYLEAFGMAILESMITGTPVISTDCSGTEELLGNSEFGIRCENSEDSLYMAMKNVLEHPELRASYAQKAIEKGKTFHKEELVAKIEEIL